jgi:hypothetical protein
VRGESPPQIHACVAAVEWSQVVCYRGGAHCEHGKTVSALGFRVQVWGTGINTGYRV